QIVTLTKKGPLQRLEGPIIACLELCANDKRKRKDADNRIKAALDYAVRLGIIEDDKQIQWVISGWIDDDKEPPPYGARLTLIETKKEGLLDMLASFLKAF